jgi:hypothetical protein
MRGAGHGDRRGAAVHRHVVAQHLSLLGRVLHGLRCARQAPTAGQSPRAEPKPGTAKARILLEGGKAESAGAGGVFGGRQRTTGNGAERLLPAEGKPRPWVCTACAAGAMAMAAPTAFSAMTATGCTLVAVARVGCGSPATHKELKKDAGSEEVGGGEGGKGGESASADQPKNWQVRTETPPVAPQNAGMAGARVREE